MLLYTIMLLVHAIYFRNATYFITEILVSSVIISMFYLRRVLHSFRTSKTPESHNRIPLNSFNSDGVCHCGQSYVESYYANVRTSISAVKIHPLTFYPLTTIPKLSFVTKMNNSQIMLEGVLFTKYISI